jgi:hypothetical protein
MMGPISQFDATINGEIMRSEGGVEAPGSGGGGGEGAGGGGDEG